MPDQLVDILKLLLADNQDFFLSDPITDRKFSLSTFPDGVTPDGAPRVALRDFDRLPKSATAGAGEVSVAKADMFKALQRAEVSFHASDRPAPLLDIEGAGDVGKFKGDSRVRLFERLLGGKARGAKGGIRTIGPTLLLLVLAGLLGSRFGGGDTADAKT